MVAVSNKERGGYVKGLLRTDLGTIENESITVAQYVSDVMAEIVVPFALFRHGFFLVDKMHAILKFCS